ncbi:Stk1 family PASTA domain-containing Ser/Thr kinase [Agrococcus jenensis]|uniref:non-specific serine/threonine protein kinase n=1 Tax=Agrococcus jenensis TaxID=46353 RepID=A0A3N2ARE8_9MICO|nr:Stk1 family PASTA domain-containing Ser/Thr kinase [Agrococcus jenensis]ROR65584.1 serine/threonine-protein kinase [Agrococcus jenensis]
MTDSIIASLRTLGDRYEIGDLIGQGGMAQVHRARDTRLDRQVAVKLLKPELSLDPEFRTRFRQEAQSAARMSHPTVVRVFDAGEEPAVGPHGEPAAVPYIVMEYVDGRMVKDIIAEGPLSEAEAVRITKGILTALEYSHRAGIVHRDIKPGNVMVTPGGQIKVMDFGIARAVSETSANVAQTGLILGTAQYFSPEQARGETVDARTDLYSTGVILFELLTGRAPFEADTAVGVAYQHVAEEPPLASSITPGITPEMDSIVTKALEKRRGDRFQTASEFKEALDDALAGVLVPFVRTQTAPLEIGAATTMFAALAADDAEPEVEQPVQRSRRPHLVWLWAAVALIGVLVVGAVVWAVSLGGSLPIAGLSTVVPTVSGLEEEAAITAIEEASLTPEVRRVIDEAEAGTVLRTEPDAGITVSPGAAVTLVISNGPPPAPLMSVANLSEAQARQALEAGGFSVGSVTRENSSTVPQDLVISTDPSAGTDVARGATVNLVLSSGLVDVPNVLERPIAAAAEELSALGLTVDRRFTTRCRGGDVVEQSLTPGAHPQGSTITLLYCNGQSRPAPAPAPAPPTQPTQPPAEPTEPEGGDNGGGNGGEEGGGEEGGGGDEG